MRRAKQFLISILLMLCCCDANVVNALNNNRSEDNKSNQNLSVVLNNSNDTQNNESKIITSSNSEINIKQACTSDENPPKSETKEDKSSIEKVSIAGESQVKESVINISHPSKNSSKDNSFQQFLVENEAYIIGMSDSLTEEKKLDVIGRNIIKNMLNGKAPIDLRIWEFVYRLSEITSIFVELTTVIIPTLAMANFEFIPKNILEMATVFSGIILVSSSKLKSLSTKKIKTELKKILFNNLPEINNILKNVKAGS